MLGAVRGVDPETGHHFDDTKRFVDDVGSPVTNSPRSTRETHAGSIPIGLDPEESGLVVATFTMDADWLVFDPEPSRPRSPCPPDRSTHTVTSSARRRIPLRRRT